MAKAGARLVTIVVLVRQAIPVLWSLPRRAKTIYVQIQSVRLTFAMTANPGVRLEMNVVLAQL
jgi:hypothetical protein